MCRCVEYQNTIVPKTPYDVCLRRTYGPRSESATIVCVGVRKRRTRLYDDCNILGTPNTIFTDEYGTVFIVPFDIYGYSAHLLFSRVRLTLGRSNRLCSGPLSDTVFVKQFDILRIKTHQNEIRLYTAFPAGNRGTHVSTTSPPPS